jgi:hypothetical protein
VIAAPSAAKAEVAIAERAGKRDLPDMGKAGNGIEHRRRRFQHSERALYFAGLVIEPFRLVLFGRAPAAFVDRQDRGIENAVAQRLHAQRCEALRGFTRDDLAAAGAVIEIFEDHPRIVKRAAILGDQHGNLAERVLPAHRVARIHRVGRLDLDVVDPEHGQGDRHLAAEWRGRCGTQDHHGVSPAQRFTAAMLETPHRARARHRP